MKSSGLTRSPTWEGLSAAIGRQFRAGVPFADIHEMNIAIKQRDLAPYAAHRARLDELLWPDDPGPQTIIDLGAGYGAMAGFWPAGSRVYNVDLPEMLEVQRHYTSRLPVEDVRIEFVPITEADRIPWDGAYLFSVWALTETTPETWAYYIEKAPRLAGAYVLGYKQWVDAAEPWPWQQLADAFRTVRLFCDAPAESYELCAVNRDVS